MGINGISTGYLAGYRYNTKTTNTRGSSFTERMGKMLSQAQMIKHWATKVIIER
ncbi:MAG: hypothetical protein J1E64_09085 [Acetatifactor sp.]|nr:hypothetical protein [Acetatifactor sp.]